MGARPARNSPPISYPQGPSHNGRQRSQWPTNWPEHPAAVIDCTGPELAWSHSRQTLLRALLEGSICTPHHTGLGVIADCDHQVAENLYAIGSPLTEQLWESVAVPELRDQAATIAARLT
jgi:uncharacterized NAD(P)/FAD-binding protein YdhS